MLAQDFINMFNVHWEKNFHPANTVCVDKSMVRWCSIGGDWINEGLPMHVAIDCKPENGCEIQLACCGEFGITTCLKLIENAKA